MKSIFKISFMEENIVVVFSSGKKRIISLEYFPVLLAANNLQRKEYQLLNNGELARWDALDFELKATELENPDLFTV